MGLRLFEWLITKMLPCNNDSYCNIFQESIDHNHHSKHTIICIFMDCCLLPWCGHWLMSGLGYARYLVADICYDVRACIILYELDWHQFFQDDVTWRWNSFCIFVFLAFCEWNSLVNSHHKAPVIRNYSSSTVKLSTVAVFVNEIRFILMLLCWMMSSFNTTYRMSWIGKIHPYHESLAPICVQCNGEIWEPYILI